MAAQTSKALILFGLGLATALSGCTRLGFGDSGGSLPVPASRSVAPLAPAPTTPVRSRSLTAAKPTPPSPSSSQTAQPVQPEKVEPVQVAKAEPPTSGKPVTRQTMVGAWTVSTGGSNCQIFLALTKWSGGYRAASRGCSAPAIADVQAWDVKSNQVVLVNSSGAQAATLYRSADERYDGSTKGGGAISFSR